MPSESNEPQYPAPVAPPGLGYVPEGFQPPPPGRGRRRLLFVLLALVAVGLLAAAGTIVVRLVSGMNARPGAGDTAFTLRATDPAGGPPSADAMEATRKVLLARMEGAKLSRPSVTVLDGQTIRLTVAPEHADRARALTAPGNLGFRMVVGSVMDEPGSAAPAGCPATASGPADLSAALGSARNKLGTDAYEYALRLTDPAAADKARLAPFAGLTCLEASALSAKTQYVVPQVSCAMLNGRVAGAVATERDHQAAACGADGSKYLLDPAAVGSADVAGAEASVSVQNGGWQIEVSFTGAGQGRWTALTREAVQRGRAANREQQVAILLDNAIVVAPVVQDEITGSAVISGTFDRDGAESIAASLRSGALPAVLTVTATGRVQ